MPIIEWRRNLCVGIPVLDQHHEHLVAMLNSAYDDFRAGGSFPQSMVQGLLNASSERFAYEERLMSEACYPSLARHRLEHAFFSSKCQELQREKDPSIEALWFLCSWVTHHICGADADFGRFHNEKRD